LSGDMVDMADKPKAVLEGSHTITAHLVIRNAAEAIEFYKKAFGAQVQGVHHMPDGKVMHASLKIGDSQLMLADEFPEMGAKSPEALGGSPVVLNIYVEDVDSLFNQAVAAGAKVTMPLANQFWGDRYGQIVDPFGHRWALGSHVEDVAPDEMERRFKAMQADMANKPKSQ
jgi:PhnB protein